MSLAEPEAGSNGGGEGGRTSFNPPSCQGLATLCRGESCCTSLNVDEAPIGYTQSGVPTRIDTFALDKYEVNVGRFELFVRAYDQWHGVEKHPFAGEGANEPGTGWDASWESGPRGNGALPNDSGALRSSLNCASSLPEYATVSRNDPSLPQNCVSWYEAFAFCIWDGGRLPTPVESEYAVTGGDLHSVYPWGNAPVPNGIDDSYAVYGCLGDGDPACSLSDILEVGSRPLGRGRWGQLDLVGSMAEWRWGWELYTFVDAHIGTSPVQRGSFREAAQLLSRLDVNSAYSMLSESNWGMRCARAKL